MNVTQKLIKVQNELKAPKGNYNSFGKYKYRSAEDILEAVKPLNADNGLLLTLSDKPTLIGEWHYIEATATITDGETSLSVTAYARESLNKKGMDESQITGTASSYARKYALNGLYLIDDTKDADTDEYQQQTNQEQAPKKATDNQLDLITKLLKGDNDRLNKMLAYYKVKDLTQLSAAQASATIKKLQGQS
jgi:hypothetical protein